MQRRMSVVTATVCSLPDQLLIQFVSLCAPKKPSVRDVNDTEPRLHIVVEFESRKLPQEKLKLLGKSGEIVAALRLQQCY